MKAALFVLLLLWPLAASAQYIDGLPAASSVGAGDLMIVCQGGTAGKPGTCTTRKATVFQVVGYGTEFDLKANCGAIGNGVADDSAALKTCIGLVNASYANHTPAWIHVPAGIYSITGTNGTMPGFATGVPGAIVGDGQHKSYIAMTSTYAGPLFSWDDAWEGQNTIYDPGPFVPSQDAAGPYVQGLTISGSLSAGSEQDGLVFYDHEDHALVQDVDFFFLPGMAISIGQTKNDATAYTRESAFRHVKMWFDGNSSKAAFNVSTVGAGTGNLVLDDVQIYAFSSAGLTFTAPASGSEINAVNMTNVRVEGNENGSQTGNNINIGLSTDSGTMWDFTSDGTMAFSQASGKYALAVTTGGTQEYSVTFENSTVGGAGTGIYAGNVRLLSYQGYNTSSGANVTLTSTTGSPNVFDGYGTESGWTFAYSGLTSPLSQLSPARSYGLPGSTSKTGTASLRGTVSNAGPIELTMDGAAPNGQNCFNPWFTQGFAFSVALLAQDVTASGGAKWYSYSLPIGYVSAWSGAGTTTTTLGTPDTVSNGTLTGIGVSIPGDTTNGCLGMTFTPPTGNTDTWNVTALVTFARAP